MGSDSQPREDIAAGPAARIPPVNPAIRQSIASPSERFAQKAVSSLGHTFSSLQHRDFTRLWLGLLFSMGGMNMQMIARGYLVYDITGSAKLLGLVSAGGAIPVLCLALFGGAVADRMARKRVIQFGQATSMAVALVVAVSIATDQVTWVHLFAAGVVQGSTWAFMMPARQAFIPQLVGKDSVGNAVALTAAGMSMTTLIAPAVAGVLYGVIGPDGVYFVISGMAFTALTLTSTITHSGRSPQRAQSAMLHDIAEGLSYVLKDRLVLVLLAISMAFVLLAMPIVFLMPVFVIEVFHRESAALGLLLSMMGLGSLVGSLVIASLGHWRRGALIIGGGFVTGTALLMIAALPFYYAAAAIMVVLGLGNAAHRAINQALVMEHVDDQVRGRVMSVYMMNFGLMPLAVLPMGVAADILGAQAVAGILGLAMLAVTAAILLTQGRLRSIQ